jgi:hypothetical protein
MNTNKKNNVTLGAVHGAELFQNGYKILHITNGNCKMPCLGILGYEKPQSGFALCAVLSPPQFGQGTFATQSPITCPNRQLPRTLCEIVPKVVEKYNE